MMKSAILTVFVVFFSIVGFSQGEWNKWCFGDHITLDFNSGLPIKIADNAMMATAGTVSISDSVGNLLFYSEGSKVWDRNNNIMPNGNGLHGIYWPEKGVLAVPSIHNDSTYYLFTVGNDGSGGGAYGLQYSIIDMKLNGGLGDIPAGKKNIIVPVDSTYNYLYGTRHKNNHDVWIVTKFHPFFMNSTWYYMSFLLTTAGLDTVPVLSSTPLTPYEYIHVINPGTIKISTDGTKFFGSGFRYNQSYGEMCHFNNETGQITHLFLFNPEGQTGLNAPYFAEFSRDNHYLYVTNSWNGSGKLYQYDATKTDSLQFVQSEVFIGTGCGPLQLASNGKIYIDGRSLSFPFNQLDSMHVINFPELGGTACGFQKNVLSLDGQNTANTSIPQFLQRYYVYIHHEDRCNGDTINFTSSIWPPADSIHWDFNDPASGSLNTSDLLAPDHVFMNPGTYNVMLIVRHNDKRMDTAWRNVTIWAVPTPNLGTDKLLCTGDSVTLDAGLCQWCTFDWNNLTTNQLHIGNGQTYKTGEAGNYSVIVTNVMCVGMDTVNVGFTNPPVITNNPLNKIICTGQSTNIQLTANVPGTNFYWTASLTSGNVTGFGPDSGLIINQFLLNPITIPGIVTYHVVPKAGSCQGLAVDFPVTVNPGDSVKVTISTQSNSVCQGAQVTFSTIPTNGGSSPSYLWKVNGGGIYPDASIMTYVPANGDIVSCILTSSNTVCISNNPATSNAISMVVNPLNPVSVSINTPDNPFCQGSMVNFTATPTNGGTTPSYSWKVNGVGVGTNNPIYSYVPANGDLVTCVMNSNIACPADNPATSNTITMIENTVNPVSIVITTPVTTVCSGISVIFTANPTNGGTTPGYQWKVNGVNSGANNSQFNYIPVNGDCISCILTSNLVCASGNPATSNSICMTVNQNLPVSITITTPLTVCAGTQVTFTVSPTNQGTLPQYQWKVNGLGVGTSSLTYSYTPLNGDQVSCVLTSNATCPTGNPAISNTITMTVNANMPVSVLISASNNPVCSGISVTYTAVPTNGGTTPVYLWKVNGINVGTNSTSYQYVPVNGDLITCTLTSNLSCTSGNPAISNTITMGVAASPVVTLTRCNDSVTTTIAQPFRLKGGIPLGGTYSGPGVINGIFYPAIAGAGTKTITYTYTNVALCTASASRSLVISNWSLGVCGSNLTDVRDGKIYPTVSIGTQCWLASNLNYGTMIPGNISQRDNCINEKYCLNDITGNCQLGTVYYQWDELMAYDETLSTQGLCPPGWHVPSEADWNLLFGSFVSNAFAAWPMLFTGYSGFNATLSATRHQNKTWDWNGFATFFWSSTSHGIDKAWSHGLNDTDASVSLYPAFRNNAFSVRCMRD